MAMIDRTKAPYGLWKVTEAEYAKAKELSCGEGDVAECAWQLIRYCAGEIFCRDDAMKALQAIRGWVG